MSVGQVCPPCLGSVIADLLPTQVGVLATLCGDTETLEVTHIRAGDRARSDRALRMAPVT